MYLFITTCDLPDTHSYCCLYYVQTQSSAKTFTPTVLGINAAYSSSKEYFSHVNKCLFSCGHSKGLIGQIVGLQIYVLQFACCNETFFALIILSLDYSLFYISQYIYHQYIRLFCLSCCILP